MKQKLMVHSILFLSLVALTACPGNNRSGNPPVATQQAPPVTGQNPITNPTPIDSNIKSFQCEFEGQRIKNHKYLNTNVNIPKTVSLITLYGNTKQNVNLRSKFLGIDIGKFGEMYMQYVPGDRTKSGADTINIVNRGLNKGMSMTQSGFAGKEVKLAATSQDGNLYVAISCKGTTSFKGDANNTGKTKLVCKGKSSTAITSVEQINFERPLNSLQAGETFEISQAVSAKLDARATTITYEASLDPGVAPSVSSTGSLGSPSMLTLSDKSIPEAEIEIECRLQ